VFDENSPRRVAVPLQSPKTIDQAASILVDWYRLLIAPDQIVELRALGVQRGKVRPHTEAGFFDADHLTELAKAALEVTPLARGVYFTLNPLKPDLLARRCNRIAWAAEGELAKDTDILTRRWLLVDADPKRDRHISASDAEKAYAHETVIAVREHLTSRGWPEPILADSGNGFHLLFRIDLPADDGGCVKRILQALAAKFDTEHVEIDQKVFNLSRICKLPGTFARKGDDVPARPHRRARLVEIPTT
jgi:hypothetical protein